VEFWFLDLNRRFVGKFGTSPTDSKPRVLPEEPKNQTLTALLVGRFVTIASQQNGCDLSHLAKSALVCAADPAIVRILGLCRIHSAH
jgi:hypothetical protein